jgi:hypothetical protein
VGKTHRPLELAGYVVTQECMVQSPDVTCVAREVLDSSESSCRPYASSHLAGPETESLDLQDQLSHTLTHHRLRNLLWCKIKAFSQVTFGAVVVSCQVKGHSRHSICVL